MEILPTKWQKRAVCPQDSTPVEDLSPRSSPEVHILFLCHMYLLGSHKVQSRSRYSRKRAILGMQKQKENLWFGALKHATSTLSGVCIVTSFWERFASNHVKIPDVFSVSISRMHPCHEVFTCSCLQHCIRTAVLDRPCILILRTSFDPLGDAELEVLACVLRIRAEERSCAD